MTSYQQTDPTWQYRPAEPPPHDPSMKDKAAEAVETGREAAGQVAQSATQHAQDVTHEAARQARDLVGEAREHLSREAGEQHRNLAGNLRSLSGELGSMVERGDRSGTATQLVSQARDQVDGLAGWLEQREPGDVLNEVKTFARRRPGPFLLGALAAGLIAGRLTRGAIAAHTEDDSAASESTALESPAAAPPTAGLAEGGYPPATGVEAGYGSTSTYGGESAPAFPSGDYSNASGYSNPGYPEPGHADPGYSGGGYPNGGTR